MSTYYNEWEPYPAQWLRNLGNAGHIPSGVVDETDIREVKADDVREFAQCHFFAGIGGWPHALQLAGWNSARPVWTASCPCQPFSSAGLRRGELDDRHLWPTLFTLIRECKPPTLFGEQVVGNDGLEWLCAVFTDLESIGYAVAGANLCAAGVGAPHVRQRLYWVATDPNSNGMRWEGVGAWNSKTQRDCNKWLGSEFAGLVSTQVQLSVSAGRDRALADGVSNRVGKLRACNAIVPQVAAQFIRAFLNAERELT